MIFSIILAVGLIYMGIMIFLTQSFEEDTKFGKLIYHTHCYGFWVALRYWIFGRTEFPVNDYSSIEDLFDHVMQDLIGYLPSDIGHDDEAGVQ